MVCFEHAIGFQAASCGAEGVSDSSSDLITALKICEKLRERDLVKEAAWVGCSPAQLRTFYLVRQRMCRTFQISDEMSTTAEVASKVVKNVAHKLARNRLVKRMGILVSEDGKFQAAAPLTGVKWQQAEDGAEVLFEDAF